MRECLKGWGLPLINVVPRTLNFCDIFIRPNRACHHAFFPLFNRERGLEWRQRCGRKQNEIARQLSRCF